jgi:predicted small metal-binding protein
MPMGDEIGKGEATLPARQIAFVYAHASVVLDGYPASEVNAGRHKRQAFRKRAAKRSQYITGTPEEVPMERVINCPCGFVLRGKSEDEVVQKAQEHAKSVHGMDLSREQALEMARPA